MNPGDTIGSYRILAIAGSGAFGQVYKAEHVVTRRVEALKIVSAPGSDSCEALQRFRREIEVHARLDHPHIATVHNAFLDHDHMVMAMEFVEGRSLQDLLKDKEVSLDTGIRIVREMLDALGYAHQHGIVHRDMKPANIIIAKHGAAKLTDFGVARAPDDIRLTQAGATVGSLAYMAPEQVRGLPSVDPRSDLYSLGAILYEIVTGHAPFEGENAFAVMQAQVEQDPVKPSQLTPSVTPALDQVILRALEKSPMQRFQTAADFSVALDAATRIPSASRPLPPRKNMRSLYASVACAMAAAVGLAIVDITLKQPPPPESPAGAIPASRLQANVEPAAPLASLPAALPAAQPPVARPSPQLKKIAAAKAAPAPPPAIIEEPDPVESTDASDNEEQTVAATAEPEAETSVETPKRRSRLLRILSKIVPRKKKPEDTR